MDGVKFQQNCDDLPGVLVIAGDGAGSEWVKIDLSSSCSLMELIRAASQGSSWKFSNTSITEFDLRGGIIGWARELGEGYQLCVKKVPSN